MPFHESGYIFDPREVPPVAPRIFSKDSDGDEPRDKVYYAACDQSRGVRDALRRHLVDHPGTDLTMLLERASDP